MTSAPRLTSKIVQHDGYEETQYHLHFSVNVNGGDWEIAANAGTDNQRDLLRYKIVPNFHHPVTATLRAAASGVNDLTGKHALPALDFVRSDVLQGTGEWLKSDVLDGGADKQPVASLQPLLDRAYEDQSDVYIFGRFFDDGNGIHDVHMNQGSSGRYMNRPASPQNAHADHDDIWQDGALFIETGAGLTAYFAAFTNQTIPTSELGNPLPGGHSV